jgi:hypothetical protein
VQKCSKNGHLLDHLSNKSTFTFLLNLFSLEWKKNHNYYIFSTEYINTDIDTSYILMYNISHTCAIIYMQFRGSKNKTYLYMVEIDPKFKKKVNLSNID